MKLKSRATLVCAAVSLPLALWVTGVARSNHAWLVLSHYFGGRAGNCTLAESFEGEALSRLQFGNIDAVRASSRVIRKDDRYSLWSTPYGEFWMPTPAATR